MGNHLVLIVLSPERIRARRKSIIIATQINTIGIIATREDIIVSTTSAIKIAIAYTIDATIAVIITDTTKKMTASRKTSNRTRSNKSKASRTTKPACPTSMTTEKVPRGPNRPEN